VIPYELETRPACSHCGSANVKRERAYKSPWVLVTCRDCGGTSEVDAAPRNEAAVRY
jgi:ribosomal protein L37AE/L43A